jgi:hypothetical protein
VDGADSPPDANPVSESLSKFYFADGW